MQVPVQVTFRHMTVSDAVETACWEEAEKLERYFDRIIGCRVIIDSSHRHQRKGNLFSVRVNLTLPGGEIAVNREPAQHQTDEDVYVAIREAFDTTRRRLEDHVRRQRHQVKTHEVPPHGRVAKLFQADGYGFIETPDGRELFFHRNAILNGDFDRLQVGHEVRFVEGEGDKGPQASSVRLVGRRQDPQPS